MCLIDSLAGSECGLDLHSMSRWVYLERGLRSSRAHSTIS
jgi:hypothetical protein